MRNKFLGIGTPGYHPIRKARVVVSGLRYAVAYDFSVAWKAVVSILLLSVAAVLHQWLDVMMILAATGLMLSLELMNSAIEALCDFVEPSENWKIGVIKDIAAAAASIGIAVWAIVLVVESSRLWERLASPA
jgi:diacylglycerol kinase (ATP)